MHKISTNIHVQVVFLTHPITKKKIVINTVNRKKKNELCRGPKLSKFSLTSQIFNTHCLTKNKKKSNDKNKNATHLEGRRKNCVGLGFKNFHFHYQPVKWQCAVNTSMKISTITTIMFYSIFLNHSIQYFLFMSPILLIYCISNIYLKKVYKKTEKV